MGHVDVLVSNAGIAQQKLFTDITPEEFPFSQRFTVVKETPRALPNSV